MNIANEQTITQYEDNMKKKSDKLLEMSKSIAAKEELGQIFKEIMQDAHKLLDADRATLFLYDEKSNELYSTVAEGIPPIRISAESGICGHVQSTGKTLNIENAYEDPRFNPSFDIKNNYKTKSILTMPIRSEETNSVIGVMQIINKANNGVFSGEDVSLLSAFCSHISVAIQHCQTSNATMSDLKESIGSVRRLHDRLRSAQEEHRKLENTQEKQKALVDVSKQLSTNLELDNLFSNIVHQARDIAEADRGTLFLYDRNDNKLWSRVGDGTDEIRILPTQGLVGQCFCKVSLINCHDAYKSQFFSPETDKITGYRTKAVLCVPILSPDNSEKAIGVLQLLNKKTKSENNLKKLSKD